MNLLSLTLLTHYALSCPAASSLPAGQAVERVAATAQAESGLHPTALHDNTTGQSYVPASEAEAATLATTLQMQGHSVDAGVMQVNDANWPRLGLTAETVFNPRLNVCAGMAVLTEAYAAERRVSCRYNTGRPDCTNGYPELIEGARRRVRAEMAAESAPPVQALSQPRPPRELPSPSNPFVEHAPAREMTFVPSFLLAAPSPDRSRPAEPAVPASPLAAASNGQRELVSMRSSNR